MEKIMDLVFDFSKIDPTDIFDGFHKKFVRITEMTADELIVAKQTLDLALKLSNELEPTQEEILLHIVNAMQVQAKRQPYVRDSYDVLNGLFYINAQGRHPFHYDHTKKVILWGNKPKPPVENNQKPREKKFGIF